MAALLQCYLIFTFALVHINEQNTSFGKRKTAEEHNVAIC
jgi:hypothetical protein